jgi:hypothetical protein
MVLLERRTQYFAGLGSKLIEQWISEAADLLADSQQAAVQATAPLYGACGTSAGEGVAPCFGGLGAGEAWRPRGLRPETWAPAPTLRRKYCCASEDTRWSHPPSPLSSVYFVTHLPGLNPREKRGHDASFLDRLR